MTLAMPARTKPRPVSCSSSLPNAMKVDRLVHHATILEFNAQSYRRRTAAKNAELIP